MQDPIKALAPHDSCHLCIVLSWHFGKLMYAIVHACMLKHFEPRSFTVVHVCIAPMHVCPLCQIKYQGVVAGWCLSGVSRRMEWMLA